jgi:hypothetical protein
MSEDKDYISVVAVESDAYQNPTMSNTNENRQSDRRLG